MDTQTTLWQDDRTGETSLVREDFEYNVPTSRITVTTDDPRWVEAVARERETLDEQSRDDRWAQGTVHRRALFASQGDLELDYPRAEMFQLTPWKPSDRPLATESPRTILCSSQGWDEAVLGEWQRLVKIGLIERPRVCRTDAHNEHDSHGRCYTCGGYRARRDAGRYLERYR